MSTEDGSLQWVARAGYVERPKSGSVRGSGCNSPDLLGNGVNVVCAYHRVHLKHVVPPLILVHRERTKSFPHCLICVDLDHTSLKSSDKRCSIHFINPLDVLCWNMNTI